MQGAPVGSESDWLVVFSQGLSPNARFALVDPEAWGGVILVTGIEAGDAAGAGESNADGEWLRSLEARGVIRIDMGCGPERGLLLRVIGARVGYAVAWSLLRTLGKRRLVENEALSIDPERLGGAQDAAADEAKRVFPESEGVSAFFAADRPLILVSEGGFGELAEQLSLKIAEGMLRPQPRWVDVLSFTHGPLQGLADGPASILYFANSETSPKPSGEIEWSERFASTLDPELHDLRVLHSRLPPPFSVLEFEAMLDELVLRFLEESEADLVDWPGAEREAALYSAGPELEAMRAARASSDGRRGMGYEEAVWPDVEAWIASGRRTALVALGSVEQHGPHLPLGTDRWIAQALADGLAERLEDAVAVPALALGCASEHLDFPGTLHVEAETLESILRDLLRSLRRHGFERAFVFSAHGGNLGPLEDFGPRLVASIPDLEVRIETSLDVAAMQASMAEGEALTAESAGPHAGEYETSVVAGLRPGAIRLSGLRAGRIVSRGEAQSLFYPSLRPNAESGVLGDPTQASGARGARYLGAWLGLLEGAYRAAFDSETDGSAIGAVAKKRQ